MVLDISTCRDLHSLFSSRFLHLTPDSELSTTHSSFCGAVYTVTVEARIKEDGATQLTSYDRFLHFGLALHSVKTTRYWSKQEVAQIYSAPESKDS